MILRTNGLRLACLILLLTSIFSAAIAADSQKLKILAVGHIAANEGISLQEATVFADALRMKLSDSKSFQVLAKSDMNQIIADQGIEITKDCNESLCAIELGQLLGVDLLVLGNIKTFDKNYSINLKLIDIQSGRTLSDVVEYYKGTLEGMIKVAAPNVVAKFTGTYKPPKPPRKKKGWFIFAGTVLIGALVAVPVGYLYLKKSDDKKEDHNTEVIVQWN